MAPQVTHIPAYTPGTGAQGGLAKVKTLQAFFKVKQKVKQDIYISIHDHNNLTFDPQY